LYSNGLDWISIGTEGKEAGQFYYPTDVQITADHIWVADAYNNRIQVFDKQGDFIRIIGADQKMNAATGLFVSENQVFVTDFENHRLLVFFKDGQFAQVIEAGLEKPIDAIIHEEKLYVIDYKKQQMNRYYFDH
jgi:DNA-binding beta-propeller fold protein YncE